MNTITTITTTAINASNTLVLLGGIDLEMLEVEKMAIQAGLPVLNKNLGWGAKLSAYADNLAALPQGTLVLAVELEQDIKPNGIVVVDIDHHNEKSTRPAAILQMAELLGVEPSRYQKLVAANDTGYIPALLAAGASVDEVNFIRAQDRLAQGVTPEQEKAAQAALDAPLEVVGDTRVFHLQGSKCAPLTDRAAVAQLGQSKTVSEDYLVVSDNGELNYFGPKTKVVKLVQRFGGWSGGGELNGFWGGYASPEEVKDELYKRSSVLFGLMMARHYS